MSASLACWTVASRSPVAGSKVSKLTPLVASTYSPPM
jgi:hypothetical protein